MATRRPIVRITGRLVELPAGDSLPGGGGGGASPLHIGLTAPVDPDATPLWWNETAGAFLVHIGGDVYIEPGANFIPAGGTAGQIAAKATGNDFDIEWVDAPAPSAQNVFIQQTEPVAASPWIWYQTDALGNVIDILKG